MIATELCDSAVYRNPAHHWNILGEIYPPVFI